MGNIVRKAYGKINLGLDVVGRLENGYHLVKMIMQMVEIYDELTFEKLPSGIVITTDSGELPTNEDNLIYKAAKLMLDTYKIDGGVKIHLEKNIPIAAGMAGGSSDAAQTFHGINELYGIGADTEVLCSLGVKVGADVPYCIVGGTMLAEGIGEVLSPLPSPPEAYLLIAKPDINVSTKEVYQKIDTEGVEKHPDIDGMIEALKVGNLQGVVDRLGNVLATVTEKMHPIIMEIKEAMIECGALGSLMSGSGPTVFGIFTDKTEVMNAAKVIEESRLAKQIFVTGFCKGGSHVQ